MLESAWYNHSVVKSICGESSSWSQLPESLQVLVKVLCGSVLAPLSLASVRNHNLAAAFTMVSRSPQLKDKDKDFTALRQGVRLAAAAPTAATAGAPSSQVPSVSSGVAGDLDHWWKLTLT